LGVESGEGDLSDFGLVLTEFEERLMGVVQRVVLVNQVADHPYLHFGVFAARDEQLGTTVQLVRADFLRDGQISHFQIVGIFDLTD